MCLYLKLEGNVKYVRYSKYLVYFKGLYLRKGVAGKPIQAIQMVNGARNLIISL